MRQILALLAITLVSLITGCASLPSLDGRTTTYAIADTAGTQLGYAATSVIATNQDKDGIHGLPEPRDAFAVRMLLADAAQKSLDVQYFIWHGDQVGYLLFEALWRAAERGVRVRVLLDDLNTHGLDPTIAALDAHPNIEVRLYNPLVHRNARALNFLTDFTRVNRRMHNKSFTADNQVSVVGGRNIANEYFGAGSGLIFFDLDVIVLGPAVRDVSKEFDLYWNSLSAYPAASLVGAPQPETTANLKSTFGTMSTDPESVAYLEAVRETALIRDLLNNRLVFEWTTAQVVCDDPAKTLDTTGKVRLLPELAQTLGRPDKTLDLVSPYFVPGNQGTAALQALAKKGVNVRILTNSLAASDVSAVHSGYAKHRRELIEAGIRLYELKPSAAKEAHEDRSLFGSSTSGALHAKTFAVDSKRIFVGSLNLDQRSARLNTEMGLVIESPVLAKRLTAFFDTEVPKRAYEVRLTTDGQDLEWIEQTPSGEKRYDTDPDTSWFLRRKVDILSILPIEWLL